MNLDPDCTIYALRVHPEWSERILESLRNKEGRFGWSYRPDADLHRLRDKVENEGWHSLNDHEKDCYQAFLLEFKEGDYVIYINVPHWGQCTLARVTGPYFWRWDGADFNHRFPVEPESVIGFDRNDRRVHPKLSARLKLQGRRWRIYLKDEFERLLDNLKAGKSDSHRDANTNVEYMKEEIRPLLAEITSKIHGTHPRKDLEPLVAAAFRNVPGVDHVEVQRGSADRGADIIVRFESGLAIPGIMEQKMCLVQVKSYEGEHLDTKAVEDLRKAFGYHSEADAGLIFSTASGSTEVLETAIEALRKETGKPIGLVIGPEVASFILKHLEY